MKALMRSHPVAMSGFLLAAAVTLFFLVRLAVHVVVWSDPAHRNMVPEPWMTVGMVAHSWHLDPAVIDEKTGFPSPRHGASHPMTLAEIARSRGVPVEEVIAELEAVILTMQAARPGP